MLVNVELKAPRARSAGMARLVSGMARIVERQEAGPRALVSSFNPIALAMTRRAAPRVATGLLFGTEQARPLREAWARRILRPLAVHPESGLADAASVGRWHGEGLAGERVEGGRGAGVAVPPGCRRRWDRHQ